MEKRQEMLRIPFPWHSASPLPVENTLVVKHIVRPGSGWKGLRACGDFFFSPFLSGLGQETAIFLDREEIKVDDSQLALLHFFFKETLERRCA